MVEAARNARVVFLRTSEVGPEKGRECRTEPGTPCMTAETNDPKPPYGSLQICRDCASPLSTPQKPEGPRRLRLGQGLWGLSGLRGGPGRSATTLKVQSLTVSNFSNGAHGR
jgi:hypothetical protein